MGGHARVSIPLRKPAIALTKGRLFVAGFEKYRPELDKRGDKLMIL